jgi:hypothetical protein
MCGRYMKKFLHVQQSDWMVVYYVHKSTKKEGICEIIHKDLSTHCAKIFPKSRLC